MAVFIHPGVILLLMVFAHHGLPAKPKQIDEQPGLGAVFNVTYTSSRALGKTCAQYYATLFLKHMKTLGEKGMLQDICKDVGPPTVTVRARLTVKAFFLDTMINISATVDIFLDRSSIHERHTRKKTIKSCLNKMISELGNPRTFDQGKRGNILRVLGGNSSINCGGAPMSESRMKYWRSKWLCKDDMNYRDKDFRCVPATIDSQPGLGAVFNVPYNTSRFVPKKCAIYYARQFLWHMKTLNMNYMLQDICKSVGPPIVSVQAKLALKAFFQGTRINMSATVEIFPDGHPIHDRHTWEKTIKSCLNELISELGNPRTFDQGKRGNILRVLGGNSSINCDDASMLKSGMRFRRSEWLCKDDMTYIENDFRCVPDAKASIDPHDVEKLECPTNYVVLITHGNYPGQPRNKICEISQQRLVPIVNGECWKRQCVLNRSRINEENDNCFPEPTPLTLTYVCVLKAYRFQSCNRKITVDRSNETFIVHSPKYPNYPGKPKHCNIRLTLPPGKTFTLHMLHCAEYTLNFGEEVSCEKNRATTTETVSGILNIGYRLKPGPYRGFLAVLKDADTVTRTKKVLV